jgi:hypothetical protein
MKTSRIDIIGQNGNEGDHYMSEKEEQLIVDLIGIIDGEHVNDGADILDRAEAFLFRRGWTRDKVTGRWSKV